MGDHNSGRSEALLAFFIKKFPDAYKEFTDVNPEIKPTVFDTDSPASPDCPKSNPCDMDCSPIGSEAETDSKPSSSDAEEDNDGFEPVITKSGKRKAAKSLKAPPPTKKPLTPAAAGAAATAPAGTTAFQPKEAQLDITEEGPRARSEIHLRFLAPQPQHPHGVLIGRGLCLGVRLPIWPRGRRQRRVSDKKKKKRPPKRRPFPPPNPPQTPPPPPLTLAPRPPQGHQTHPLTPRPSRAAQTRGKFTVRVSRRTTAR
ncbi:unnamed protein product [Danaus chrysippus]|uniref:(African queen) hypothetical protein n=1 Tax=Danaus chrysippus TaxID=151541 RepID=A0A8J2R020_9NEOP|nr:unnamed protein product [Danaus chrysippus]